MRVALLSGRARVSPPSWITVVSDPFNRANVTSPLGVSDSGHLWITPYGHTWGIATNKAYSPTDADTNPRYVIIDSGLSSFRQSVEITNPGQTPMVGLHIRIVDWGNRITVFSDGWGLNVDLYNSAGWARIGSYNMGQYWPAGQKLTVVNQGQSIKVYLGAATTPVIDITDPNFVTATQQGMYVEGATNDTGARLDNYLVEHLGPLYTPERSAGMPFKGMDFANQAETDYSSANSDTSIGNLAATGTEWVGIVAVHGVSGTTVGDASTWTTPTDAQVQHSIQTAHGLGLSVMVKPQFESSGTVGAAYSDANWASFFTSYGTRLLDLAALCETEGVEMICVGTEMFSASGQEARWRSLIASVRAIYSGKLTYCAADTTTSFLNEDLTINWWDALDYIGISAYYPMTAINDPTVAQLNTAWGKYLGFGRTLAQKFRRPVLFTEIGCRSMQGANIDPTDWATQNAADQSEQANYYQAFFDTVWPETWFAGAFWWSWDANPAAPVEGDTSFSPWGKAAQAVLESGYAS